MHADARARAKVFLQQVRAPQHNPHFINDESTSQSPGGQRTIHATNLTIHAIRRSYTSRLPVAGELHIWPVYLLVISPGATTPPELNHCQLQASTQKDLSGHRHDQTSSCCLGVRLELSRSACRCFRRAATVAVENFDDMMERTSNHGCISHTASHWMRWDSSSKTSMVTSIKPS